MARVQGERLAATVERIPDDAAIPAAIARYLQAEGAPLSLALPSGPGNGKLGLDRDRDTSDVGPERRCGHQPGALGHR